MQFKKHFNNVSRVMPRNIKIPTIDLEYVNEQVEVDGVIVNRQTKKLVDRSKSYIDFKATDFSLQNQLAVGGLNSLKPVQLTTNDIDLSIDSVGRLNAFLEHEISASKQPDSNPVSKE